MEFFHKLFPLNVLLLLLYFSSYIYPADIVLKKKEQPRFNPRAAACLLKAKGSKDVFGCPSLVNDPNFLKQWYIVPRPERVFENRITHDLGILEVWLEDRVYGEGVVVVDFDDGLDFKHRDLRENFDSRFALDFCINQPWQPSNLFPMQPDDEFSWQPIPLTIRPRNKDEIHGTKAAGVIGMGINNHTCGVGIAPLVTLGAFRVNVPKIMSFWFYFMNQATNNMNNIDIAVYGFASPRWYGIPHIERQYLERLEETSLYGRGGRGTIHVWSAGNDHLDGFSCAFNTYFNNIHTIAVAAVNPFGGYTSFSDKCTAIMVAAPTSSHKPLFFPTIKENGKCTDTFGGTSASAPVVAGILALLLSANPWLTWRDVQHLLTVTSTTNSIIAASFQVNGAGFWVSHDFGFGIINAKNLVRRSYNWQSVPEMRTCIIPVTVTQPVFIPPDFLQIEIDTNACQGTADEVNYLEHVQLSAQLGYTKWNALQMDLTSPRGTHAVLIPVEPKNTHQGDAFFIIDSIITWGENPRGKWNVIVRDSVSPQEEVGLSGHISSVRLKLFGTKDKPPHYD